MFLFTQHIIIYLSLWVWTKLFFACLWFYSAVLNALLDKVKMIKVSVYLALFSIADFVMVQTPKNASLVLVLMNWVQIKVFANAQLDKGQLLMVDVDYVWLWTVQHVLILQHCNVKSANLIFLILKQILGISVFVNHLLF